MDNKSLVLNIISWIFGVVFFAIGLVTKRFKFLGKR